MNYIFIARCKKDGGWDAVVSSSLTEHNAKMDDVKARGQHNFLIDYRHPRSTSREALGLSPVDLSPALARQPSVVVWS